MVLYIARVHAFVFILLFTLSVGLGPAVLKPSPPDPPLHVPQVPPDLIEPYNNTRCTEEDTRYKDLDVIVYGATGYVGKLAAQYIAAGLPEDPRWAIAGVNLSNLDNLRNNVLKDVKSDPEPIFFGTGDVPAMTKMLGRARVVLNFAGPFEENGAEWVLQKALKGCTHYIDISTETHWQAAMLKKYGSIAKIRGIAIVQSAGFASVLSDFLAVSAIEEASKIHGSLPAKVNIIWQKDFDAPSGGMIASKHYATSMHGSIDDPYLLAPETPTSMRVDSKVDGMDSYGFRQHLDFEVESFYWGEHDCSVIRRSIYQQFHAPISISEAADVKLVKECMVFLSQPFFSPVKKKPRPGEGPPTWVQERGSFAAEALAHGYNNKRENQTSNKNFLVHVSLDGIGAGSSIVTAKVATELALGLAFNGPVRLEGGYLTPALALGTEVLERRLTLVDHGQFIRITHGMLH